jgi:hypothetical protein
MSYVKDWCRANGYDYRLYICWMSMRWRCTNPKRKDYHRYGGRGIKVCARWGNYANFAADMGPHPGKGFSLDRKRNNENYRHGNCRWATTTVQNRNRNLSTRSGKLTLAKVARIRKLYAGDARSKRGSISQQALADRYGISRPMVSYILKGTTWK